MTNATADIFASAVIAPPKEKKAAKDKKVEIRIGTDLDLLAAADALQKTLKTVAEVHATDVKALMAKHFSHEGVLLGRRPENFRGLGDKSSASCQLKQRDSRRVLVAEEIEYLKKAGVAMEEKVTQEEAFLFNQDVLADPVLRAKISAAFALIDFGGLNPLVKQERIVSMIANDQSLETAYAAAKTQADAAKTDTEKKAAEAEAEKLAALVGTFSITPKFDGSLQDAMQVLIAAGVTL